MAFPTSVNSQITDAVTQANVKVLADAPAMALGSLYQSMAQASGLAAQNATTVWSPVANRSRRSAHRRVAASVRERIDESDTRASSENRNGCRPP